MEDVTQPRKKRKIMTRNAPTIMDKFRPADTSNVEIESDIFENLEFCVLNGMEMMDENYMRDNQNDEEYVNYLQKFTKQELEKLIVANGGIITQNPMIQSTNHLIAERITPRVSNIIDSDISVWNVIRPIWLIQSAENRRILPFQPTHMIHSTKVTSNLLKESFDKFGDHYVRPTNVDNLIECFRKMNKNTIKKNESKTLDDDDDDDIDLRLNDVNPTNWLKTEWEITDEEEMMLIEDGIDLKDVKFILIIINH